MKNQLIGALVAGLILFIWQFISYGPGQLHASQMQHTPNQDAVLEALSANLEDGGQYFIPNLPPSATGDDQNAYMQERIGKPWATVSYHASLQDTFGSNLIRGFIIDFLAAFLLCWLFGKMSNLDMKTCLMVSVAVGLIGYLTINYLDAIWFKGNSIPDLIDAVVGWGLVGAWLGWWLPSRS